MERAISSHRVYTSSTVESVERTISTGRFFSQRSKASLWEGVRYNLKQCEDMAFEDALDSVVYRTVSRLSEECAQFHNLLLERQTAPAFFNRIDISCTALLDFFCGFYWAENDLAKEMNAIFQREYGEIWDGRPILTVKDVVKMVRKVSSFLEFCKRYRLTEGVYFDCKSCNYFVEKPTCVQLGGTCWVTQRFYNKLRVLQIPHEVLETAQTSWQEQFLLDFGGLMAFNYVPNENNSRLLYSRLGEITIEFSGLTQRYDLSRSNIQAWSNLVSMLRDYHSSAEIDRQCGVIDEIYKAGNDNFVFAHSGDFWQSAEKASLGIEPFFKVNLNEVLSIDLLYGFGTKFVDPARESDRELLITYSTVGEGMKQLISSAYLINTHYGVQEEDLCYNSMIMYKNCVISCSRLRGINCSAAKKMVSDYSQLVNSLVSLSGKFSKGRKELTKHRFTAKPMSDYALSLLDNRELGSMEFLPVINETSEAESESLTVFGEGGPSGPSVEGMDPKHAKIVELIDWVAEEYGEDLPKFKTESYHYEEEVSKFKRVRNRVSSLEKKKKRDKNQENEYEKLKQELRDLEGLLSVKKKEQEIYDSFRGTITEKITKKLQDIEAKNKKAEGPSRSDGEELQVLKKKVWDKLFSDLSRFGKEYRKQSRQSLLDIKRYRLGRNNRKIKKIESSVDKRLHRLSYKRSKIAPVSIEVAVDQYCCGKYYGTSGIIKNSERKIAIKTVKNIITTVAVKKEKGRGDEKNSPRMPVTEIMTLKRYTVTILIFQSLVYESEIMDKIREIFSSIKNLNKNLLSYKETAREEVIKVMYGYFICSQE